MSAANQPALERIPTHAAAADRLLAVVVPFAARKQSLLAELKANSGELDRPDFLWRALIEAFSTMGKSSGWHGLVGNRANYDRVTYEALAALSPEARAAQVSTTCAAAKIRMPQRKAVFILGCFDRVTELGGPVAAKAALLASPGRDSKIRFLKAFPGIGDKYARNILMDVYHPDFHSSIAIDARIAGLSQRLGVEFPNYREHEAFYLRVAARAGLNGWELDRLLYNGQADIERALDVTSVA